MQLHSTERRIMLRLRSIFLFFACLCLAACVTTPIFTYAKPIDYAAMPIYTLDVYEAAVVNDTKPTEDTLHFARTQGDTPETELRRWVNTRIRAAGTRGSFSLVIRDANFVRKKLNKPTGWKSWLTRDQEEVWHAYLDVLMSVDGGQYNQTPSEIQISVRSSHTVPEHAIGHERDRIYNLLLNELMTSFNTEVEEQIYIYFREYIR